MIKNRYHSIIYMLYIYIHTHTHLSSSWNIHPARPSPLTSAGRDPFVWHRFENSKLTLFQTNGTNTGRTNTPLVYSISANNRLILTSNVPSYPSHQFPPSSTHDMLVLVSLHDCLRWPESIFCSKYSPFKYMKYTPSFKSIMKKGILRTIQSLEHRCRGASWAFKLAFFGTSAWRLGAFAFSNGSQAGHSDQFHASQPSHQLQGLISGQRSAADDWCFDMWHMPPSLQFAHNDTAINVTNWRIE